MGLGAIPQAPRLNLGKFRVPDLAGLIKLVCNVEPTSGEERLITLKTFSNRREIFLSTKWVLENQREFSEATEKRGIEKTQLRLVARLALASVKRRRKFCTYNRSNVATVFFPERLVASWFLVTFYQEKVMKKNVFFSLHCVAWKLPIPHCFMLIPDQPMLTHRLGRNSASSTAKSWKI